MSLTKFLKGAIVLCASSCIVTVDADDISSINFASNVRWIPVVKNSVIALQVVNGGSSVFEVSPDARIYVSDRAIKPSENHSLEIKPYAKKDVIYVSLTFVGNGLNANVELPSNGAIRPAISIKPGESKVIELNYSFFLGRDAKEIVAKCDSIRMSFDLNDAVINKVEFVQNREGSWKLK